MSKNAISDMSVEQLIIMRAINMGFIAGFALRTEFDDIDDLRACEIYNLHVFCELKLTRAMNLLENERWKQENVCCSGVYADLCVEYFLHLDRGKLRVVPDYILVRNYDEALRLSHDIFVKRQRRGDYKQIVIRLRRELKRREFVYGVTLCN